MNGNCWTDCDKNYALNYLVPETSFCAMLNWTEESSQNLADLTSKFMKQSKLIIQGWLDGCEDYMCFCNSSSDTHRSFSVAVKSSH